MEKPTPYGHGLTIPGSVRLIDKPMLDTSGSHLRGQRLQLDLARNGQDHHMSLGRVPTESTSGVCDLSSLHAFGKISTNNDVLRGNEAGVNESSAS